MTYRTSFTAAARADREETIVDGRFSSSGDIALSDGSATQGAIYFADDKNTGIYSPSNDSIAFSTAGTSRLIISSDGKIGVNTTPDSFLHIKTSTNNNVEFEEASGNLRISALNDARDANRPLEFASSAFSFLTGSASFGGAITTGNTWQDDTFQSVHINATGQVLTKSNVPGDVAIAVHQGGNQTDDRTFKVQVDGTLTTSSGAAFSGNVTISNGAPKINLVDTTTDQIDYAIQLDAGLFEIRDITNDAYRLKIDSTGNVTIGQVLYSPGTYSNTTNNAANVSCPNSNGQFYRSTSSRKYKDNITTLTDSDADKILNCRPVSFTSKCDNDDKSKIHYGLIAEEVAEIDSRLVNYNTTGVDTPEIEGVQYDRFIPHLINLIKRQSEKITVLETKVAALESA